MDALLPIAADAPAESRYAALEQALRALMDGERDAIANTANAAALLYFGLPALNWAGFYLLKGEELVLGPFQGRPACLRIPLGQGVCGSAALKRRTLVVPDVHAFPSHIACDSASNAEIVVPFSAGTRLLGVLDLDSPERGRFGDLDARSLEGFAAILVAGCDWPPA
jgi:L-methionine (R)-S-oxide reductase